MANFYKMRVDWKGKGHYCVGSNIYSHGDTFVLTQENFNKFVKPLDIMRGNLVIIGESDTTDFSANIAKVLDGKTYQFSRNYAPASVVGLTGVTTAGATGCGTQGNDLAGAPVFGRRVQIGEFLVKRSAEGALTPRLLVTAGEPTLGTPTLLTTCAAIGGAYAPATNGLIAAATPITFAANDRLIVGYSDQFRSLLFNCTSGAGAGSVISDVSYWNGSAWTAFDTGWVDYTKAASAGSSFASTYSGARVVWFEKPTDWVPGGPVGSGANSSTYCIALKVNGALTSLANGAVYPVLDMPIADMMLGTSTATPTALVTKDTVYTDQTAQAVPVVTALTTAQYLYAGSTTPFNGLNITISSVNSVNALLRVEYWTGKKWSSAVTTGSSGATNWSGGLTDSTFSAGTLAISGSVSWAANLSDWRATTAASVTGLSTSTPVTVTTTPLYWIRLSAASSLTGTTAMSAVTLIPEKGYVSVEPKNGFVEAGQAIRVSVIDADANAVVDVKAVISDI